MKKLILIGFLLLQFLNLSAQTPVTKLNIQSNPNSVLSQWMNDQTVMIYTISIQGNLAYQILINAQIKSSDGSVIASKNLVQSVPFTLASGNSFYYAKDVMPIEEMIFNGSYKSSVLKTGKLPAGNYQITIQLVKAGTFEPVSDEVTGFFNVVAPQLPVLVLPVQYDTLNKNEAQDAIIFRWTSVIP